MLYLRQIIIQGHTSICFEENQLFLSLFSLSLLPTIHPKNFQLLRVRTSTKCYFRFILIMGRSLKFRVYILRLNRPIRTRFRFGFPFKVNLATESNSLAHYAKGTVSHFIIVLHLLVGCQFQVLFTPLAGVLFTFPSRY